MPEVKQGSLEGRGLRVGVVVSRFNRPVTDRLLQGALGALATCGVTEEDLIVASVPGAVEIPGTARILASRGDIDAVVALGAVIRGETSHYDFVCRMVADGCLRAALDSGRPVSFGVLTCETPEQALARSGDGRSNKGWEAAEVAIEIANLHRELVQ